MLLYCSPYARHCRMNFYILPLCGYSDMNQLVLCVNGEVRHANGYTEREGRVDVCIKGVWSTVCGKNWDDREAQTVCQQLKYPSWGEEHTDQHHKRA